MINKYVPILRPKQGELTAIRELTAEARSRITPFFDIHRVTLADQKKKKTLQEHLESVTNKIAKVWNENAPFFVDLSTIDLKARLRGGAHPVKYVSEKLAADGYKFIFTTGTDRDEEYNTAISSGIVFGHIEEVCFRVLSDDLDVPANVLELLAFFKLKKGEVHLLIDLRYIQEEELDMAIDRIASFCSSIEIAEWKSFTLVSSSFPLDMGGLPANGTAEVPRTDLELWKMAVNAEPLIGRRPHFGDYGLVNPEKPDLDPVMVRAAGKIRYTTESSWLVLKGHLLSKGERYRQYKTLSKKLLAGPQYMGKDYSWGDAFIQWCADASANWGNLTTWVKVDTNHHLTFVGAQVANFSGSLAE